MKTDPDFHPAASAWLEGSATSADQSVLQEILYKEPGHLHEFAALCHTEVILQQAAADPTSRLQALEKLMARKPLKRRVAVVWKSRLFRLATAAALIVLATWLAYPEKEAAPSGATAKKSGTANPINETRARNVLAGDGGETSQYPVAAPGFELLLKRHYFPEFKANGSLGDAVALLVKDLKTTDGKSPAVEILDSGDAPVFLNLQAALPAWSLLQLMAIQTGTTIELSEETILFRAPENPPGLDRFLTQSADTTLLQMLFSPVQELSSNEGLSEFGTLMEAAFGSRLSFANFSENKTQYTGSARSVKVLTLALDELAHPSVKVAIQMKLVEFAFQSGLQDRLSDPVNEDFSLTGVFTEPQFQMMMRGISQMKGVNLMTLPLVTAPPNWQIGLPESAGDALGVSIAITAKPMSNDTCGLSLKIAGRAGNPDRVIDVLIWNGQTVVLTRLPQPDGSKPLLYITAHLTDADGTPLDPSASPKTPGPETEENLPACTLFPGTEGLFFSPFAPEMGVIDLTAVKSGATVQCPFTGKFFRKP